MKLCVFDFDSTLMDGETIDYLADELGFKEEVSFITKKAMNGEIDFFESLVERVAFLKGMTKERVDDICHNLPYMNGAKETIRELRQMGFKVIVFSGGFRNATDYAKDILGFNASFSNILHEKNGILSGKVGGEMMFGFSKGDMLNRLQQLFDITRENTIVVGDGANDLSMFKHAKIKVAFCAKKILKDSANIVVDEKNLIKILEKIDEF